MTPLKAPFPYFGGKSSVAAEVWARLGSPKQYLEPFCGSAAMLLAAPKPASLEVIGDQNCYIANFWRALKFQPDDVWQWQDYPVSHIDLYARHLWLTEPARVAALRDALIDPDWPGDAKVAGWWLWGQCAWIGGGWCDRRPSASDTLGQVPHSGNAGRGVQAASLGKVPHTTDAGRGVQRTSVDGSVRAWLRQLSDRLARVRVVHGDWSRCMNHHYGGGDVALFLDPPYRNFESLYSGEAARRPVADQVAEWAAEHADLRIAICGHRDDYQLPMWDVFEWSRGKLTYGSAATTDSECIWFSPACLQPERQQRGLFDAMGPTA